MLINGFVMILVAKEDLINK